MGNKGVSIITVNIGLSKIVVSADKLISQIASAVLGVTELSSEIFKGRDITGDCGINLGVFSFLISDGLINLVQLVSQCSQIIGLKFAYGLFNGNEFLLTCGAACLFRVNLTFFRRNKSWEFSFTFKDIGLSNLGISKFIFSIGQLGSQGINNPIGFFNISLSFSFKSIDIFKVRFQVRQAFNSIVEFTSGG